MSVFENVAYGLRRRKDTADLSRRVGEVLAMTGLSGYEKRTPGTLSGGEQQRAALARALVYKSDLVLLDEPLSNLDAKLRKELRGEIRRIHDELKLTMVYVTHDQEEAAAMSDRMALINQGQVVQTGTFREICEKPANPFAAAFLGD
jgi:ABC-type Fe3+/spermidine/putrescine transport system ATPase subunit